MALFMLLIRGHDFACFSLDVGGHDFNKSSSNQLNHCLYPWQILLKSSMTSFVVHMFSRVLKTKASHESCRADIVKSCGFIKLNAKIKEIEGAFFQLFITLLLRCF